MTNQSAVTKAVEPDKLRADSVQSAAHQSSLMFGGSPGLSQLLFYRQKTDLDVPPWGYGGRGLAMRRVWRLAGADIVASAIAVTLQKVASTTYTLEGPQRTVNQAQQMIDAAELGKGWMTYSNKWCIDYLTQDNGAFTELLGPGKPLRQDGVVVRFPDGMPVMDVAQAMTGKPISIAHLDSVSCERTGIYETPVRYYDINGNMHLLNDTRVHFVADMPQPDERLFGYGFCALSRCIATLQYGVNWSTLRNEALDNMPPLSIMTLENINKEVFEEQMTAYEADRQAIDEKVLRSLMTLVQQDPSKPTKVVLTPIRQLWESFDELQAFQTTVNTVAMAFGLDPQELAPLASSSMGSGAQSTVLDEKARGKGVGNILAQLEALMRSVLPASVTFRFDRQDDAEDMQRATIRETKARTVLSLFTGSTTGAAHSTGMDAGQPGGQNIIQGNSPLTPVTNLLPAVGSDIPEPTSLLDRDQAQRLLMYEVPEWADIIDPDMSLRQEVVVDDLDPDVAQIQQKMYGVKVRYFSKSRKTIEYGKPRQHTKAGRVVVSPITKEEIAASKARLAAIGINVDELRQANAPA